MKGVVTFMKCREVDFLLGEYYENSLDLNERKMVEKHLGECENCRLRLKEMEQTYQLLEKESIPQPEESFWVNFLPEIRARIEKKQKPKEKLVPKSRLAFSILSVLTVAIIAFHLFSVDRENIAQRRLEQSGEGILIESDFSSYAEQLANAISSEGDSSISLEIVLSESDRQNLDLTETLLKDDYLSQEDLGSILNELNSEELKRLEENVKHLQLADIL